MHQYFAERRFHVSRETLLRPALIGLGPPEIGARIEGSYAVEKRAERWLSRAFEPGERVSSENNPIEETQNRPRPHRGSYPGAGVAPSCASVPKMSAVPHHSATLSLSHT